MIITVAQPSNFSTNEAATKNDNFEREGEGIFIEALAYACQALAAWPVYSTSAVGQVLSVARL